MTFQFLRFFSTLFKKNKGDRFLPTPIEWDPISDLQRNQLELPFTEEEIWIAIKALGSNKSPGPDGYTAEFFKKTWNILKADLLKVFQDFFEKGIINASVNETYICLIPKKIDTRTMGDYRPISLTTGLYKIIARVLSNRLKVVLRTTIMCYQSAFVEDRQILDASLIANEIIEEWHRKKIQGVVIKLDIEKAFNKVDWDILDAILKLKGFGIKWRR